MADLEERLRATIARRSEGFLASPDLPDRIDARVRRRRRQRRLVRGGLAAAAVAAAATVVVLVGPIGDDEGSIRTTDPDGPGINVPDQSSTTTSEGGPTSSTSGASTTGGAPQQPAATGIDPLTSLSRQGFGPITAGMTLRQAQEAAGVTITPSPGSGSCIEAGIEGVEGIVLLVEPTGGEMDGVVRAVTGSVLPTEEGAIVGQSRDELLAALGQPTRTEPDRSGLGGEILVFEAGGHAYGALVLDGLVLGLQSGDPAWVSSPDGCP
jgi:hypothetical protein